MLEIETSEAIDGGFDFERVRSELVRLNCNSDGYFVLFCPTQGSLRVERYPEGFSVERRTVPGKVHHEISEPNEGQELSLEQAEAIFRRFFDNAMG